MPANSERGRILNRITAPTGNIIETGIGYKGIGDADAEIEVMDVPIADEAEGIADGVPLVELVEEAEGKMAGKVIIK